MSRCERIGNCSFFRDLMADTPYSADIFRRNYCQSNKEMCARHMVHQKVVQGYMPPDEKTLHFIGQEMDSLFPNHTDQARKIISFLVKY